MRSMAGRHKVLLALLHGSDARLCCSPRQVQAARDAAILRIRYGNTANSKVEQVLDDIAGDSRDVLFR